MAELEFHADVGFGPSLTDVEPPRLPWGGVAAEGRNQVPFSPRKRNLVPWTYDSTGLPACSWATTSTMVPTRSAPRASAASASMASSSSASATGGSEAASHVHELSLVGSDPSRGSCDFE